MKKRPPPKRLLEFEPMAAITLSGSGGSRGRTRWALLLVWFCRICAVLWLLAGLQQWAFILGIIKSPEWAFILGIIVTPHISFEAAGTPIQLAAGFFAVIDIIAAVGLWLTAPWGSTVWLLSAIAQVAFLFALHDHGGANAVTISINTILIAIFIIINYMYRRKYRYM